MIRILGGGIAGQVLARELFLRGVEAFIEERQAFPREKVCGGVLQESSLKYLERLFDIRGKVLPIEHLAHFWEGKPLSRFDLNPRMYYISRLSLDHCMNKQQNNCVKGDQDVTTIDASGISGHDGQWIGFNARARPVKDLEMHYAQGIYGGLSPTGEDYSHTAFLVHKDLVKGIKDWKSFIQKSLGFELLSSPKGTKKIHYGYSGKDLAIGDAKMTTHPFLGLGMKHAMESAQLMAQCIEGKDLGSYSRRHRQQFRRMQLASQLSVRVFQSPMRGVLVPILKQKRLFSSAYQLVHKR